MNINLARHIPIKQFAVFALLAICLTQLPARGGQAERRQIELQSFSWGMVPGQKTRITAANRHHQGGSGLGGEPLIWRVSAVDADGNQVFQSSEVVTPAGGFRYIDVEAGDIPIPSDTLTGRKQVLWKVVLFGPEIQSNLSLVSAELIDSAGTTTLGHTIGLRHEHTRPE